MKKNNFQLTNYILEVEGTEKYNILTNNNNSFDIKQYNQGYKKFAGRNFTFKIYNQNIYNGC